MCILTLARNLCFILRWGKVSGTTGPAGPNPSWPKSGRQKKFTYTVWFSSFLLGIKTITVIFWQEPLFIYSLCSGLKMRKKSNKV